MNAATHEAATHNAATKGAATGNATTTQAMAKSAAGGSQGNDTIARGRYLATAGDCAACHTAPGGAPLAGGLSLNTPFGSLSTPNITPDKATGIGAWTDDEFYRVMHEGIGRHGEYLYPAMPFPWYTKVSREDVLAIKAYLFSLPPVHRPRSPDHMSFPFSVRGSLLGWRQIFFKPGDFQPDPSKPDEVNRGAYLVNGLGHCGECHDSHLIAGTSKFQKPLQGGVIDGWFAPAINSSGISGWSDAQLLAFLKTGVAPGKAIAVGPMAETVHSLAQLSDQDLKSIAAYLRSTPAAQPPASHAAAADTSPGSAGSAGYLDNCAACHGVRGEGLEGVVPALAGNAIVQARGAEDVVRAMLGGLEAHGDYGPMLAIGAAMDDRDVADVANYVRASWGNAAPATATASLVHDLRAKTDTPMNPARQTACPPVQPAALARALADPSLGLAQRLASTREADMPQQVQAIVAKLDRSVRGVSRADLVNGMTAAYCPVVRAQTGVEPAAQALQLGHFGELVYMQLASHGIAASAR